MYERESISVTHGDAAGLCDLTAHVDFDSVKKAALDGCSHDAAEAARVAAIATAAARYLFLSVYMEHLSACAQRHACNVPRVYAYMDALLIATA